MDKIIHALVNIDKQARDSLKTAFAQKDDALKKANQQKQQIYQEYEIRAKEEIEALKVAEFEKNKQHINDIEAECRDKKLKLLSVCEKNKSQWEELIVNSCLGR